MPTGASSGYILTTDVSGNARWVSTGSLVPSETDPKVGSLSLSYVPKWNGTTLANGNIFDTGTGIGIGTASPGQVLDVNGNIRTNSNFINNKVSIGNTSETVTFTSLSTNTVGTQNNFLFTGPLNGGGTGSFIMDSAGQFGTSFGTNMRFLVGGAQATAILSTGYQVKNTNLYNFSSDGNPAGATDTAFGRNAAGIVEINNGTLGQYRDLQVRSLNPSGTNLGI